MNTRKREVLWAGACLALAYAYLSDNDTTDQLVVEARKAEIAQCLRDRENGASHARTLALILDKGGSVMVGEKVAAECRKVKS